MAVRMSYLGHETVRELIRRLNIVTALPSLLEDKVTAEELLRTADLRWMASSRFVLTSHDEP